MRKIIVMLTILTSQQLWAHGDHEHRPTALPSADERPLIATCAKTSECTKEEISASSDKALKFIAEKNPAKASWAAAGSPKVDLKGKEWKLTYKDDSKSAGEKSLYVYISKDGYLERSNFTGK